MLAVPVSVCEPWGKGGGCDLTQGLGQPGWAPSIFQSNYALTLPIGGGRRPLHGFINHHSLQVAGQRERDEHFNSNIVFLSLRWKKKISNHWHAIQNMSFSLLSLLVYGCTIEIHFKGKEKFSSLYMSITQWTVTVYFSAFNITLLSSGDVWTFSQPCCLSTQLPLNTARVKFSGVLSVSVPLQTEWLVALVPAGLAYWLGVERLARPDLFPSETGLSVSHAVRLV